VSIGVPPPTAGTVAADRFPPHSRYASTEVVTDIDPSGDERRYLCRRFVPSTAGQATIAEHLVVAGDRLDLLAQQYYGDPLLGWRIADANLADDPADLVAEPGRVLKIPAPDAMGGFGGAA
jgi:nucleoid-associated protein YgaU